MLARLNKARSFIKQQTAGRYDTLENFIVLKNISDAFNDAQLKINLK
jgi:hypothetical protein